MASLGLESGRADPPPSADGKLYDAYVSYSDSPEDRKFVNFILKPQLERRRGYKLFLDDRDLLPRAGTAAPCPFPLGPSPDPGRRPRPCSDPDPAFPGPRPSKPISSPCRAQPHLYSGPAPVPAQIPPS